MCHLEKTSPGELPGEVEPPEGFVGQTAEQGREVGEGQKKSACTLPGWGPVLGGRMVTSEHLHGRKSAPGTPLKRGSYSDFSSQLPCGSDWEEPAS